MDETNKSGLEGACKELWSGFQGVLSWKWDGRFQAVLAEFSAAKKVDVRTILERSLRNAWESSNIGSAPDRVREISGRLGGLRPGQLLFTSDPGQETFIFCAWWPWGDNKTISIRIGSSSKKLSDPEKAEMVQLLKKWFGI